MNNTTAVVDAAALTSLNIVSAGALETIPEGMRRASNTVIVASLQDLTHALEVHAAAPRVEALTVDLVGHSTRDHQLLRLGTTTIDALDLGVLRFFEGLARSSALRELNVACVRLLGCETAISGSGQRTLRLLASVLGIPVYGTLKRIRRTHHTERGFNPVFQHILVEASPRRHHASGYHCIHDSQAPGEQR